MTNKEMPLSEALRIMKIERECVLRQDTPECNRDECGCQCCDLVQEPDDVVAAYDAIIKAAEAQAKTEEQTAWFKDALDKRQFNHEKEFFDGHCPYTDNFCSVWTCNDCEESKREKEASERVDREKEEAIKILSDCKEKGFKYTFYTIEEYHTAIDMAIKALEQQEPKTGHWLRMSDLSEQEDDRYKCSRCGNVVHYTLKRDLYTFNGWCGRCGSDNGRHINYEVEE